MEEILGKVLPFVEFRFEEYWSGTVIRLLRVDSSNLTTRSYTLHLYLAILGASRREHSLRAPFMTPLPGEVTRISIIRQCRTSVCWSSLKVNRNLQILMAWRAVVVGAIAPRF